MSETNFAVNRAELDHHYFCPKAGCGKRFNFEMAMNTHVMRHDGIKPHKCKLCDKGFVTRNECIQHETTHSTERKYKCCFCHKPYKNHCSLNNHKRNHCHIKREQMQSAFDQGLGSE
jgi:uncharacterized Zn-finger protein